MEDRMRSRRYEISFLVVGFAVLVVGGCAKKERAAPPPAANAGQAPTPAGGGKIPITTSSAEAKSEFLQGRDLAEKLRITDSIQHYEKAVSLDPSFATAELNLATSAPTGKEFFDHLNKAVSLADKASNGERLLILATQAGANNDALKQKEYLEQLVAAYPNDERAQFNLGTYCFGQQDFPQAIEHLKKALEVEPNYSNACNLLGYAYRQTEDYASAEKAFQKYIQLIPNDPNPYDSYAELLLKMGRFDDSIAQYRKALAIEPSFLNAHQGIAMDLLYSGKPKEAAAELDHITERARNDGERRTALFGQSIVDIDGGKWAKALDEVDKQYALGEKTHDVPAMAFDRGFKGNVLLEMGKPDQAAAEFQKSVALVEGSDLSPEIKNNTRLVHHFNLALVALRKKDFAVARKEAEAYRTGVAESKNPIQKKFAHELDGTIALAEKDYDKALAELPQANLQNPYNLYRLGQAYQGKGDQEKAKEFYTKAANFNGLPNQNYAYIRVKAKTQAAVEKKA
jgi:tetratricopeptide (TPR) repeat protein